MLVCRLIHGHISSRAARFRALAVAAAAEIDADADNLPGDAATMVVSLREYIGRRATAISAGALGDDYIAAGGSQGGVLPAPMANDAMGVSAFVSTSIKSSENRPRSSNHI